jgi:SNF2 family DNA or RNA helicase
MLAPHMLQRKQADVLHDLPPLRWGHIVVPPDSLPPQPDLTPEQQALLYSLRSREPSSADAMHLASLRRWTGITKAPAVAELIEDQLDSGIEKLVVFAIHRSVIEVLGRIKDAAVIHGDTPGGEREELLRKFQRDAEPRVLVLQLATGGTALTLTAACHVLFAEISWSPADNVQAAARCHRIGQTRSVLAQIVSLAGSIDEGVGATVLRKSAELAELDARIAEAS